MEIEAADRYNGRDGLFRALIFIFFLVGSLPGKSVVYKYLSAPPAAGVSIAVFVLLVLLALTFTGLPMGFAMLPVCSLFAGAYIGFLAQFIVTGYVDSGAVDTVAVILCAVFTPAYFAITHSGMRCCGMLSKALERCGESAQTEYSKALVPIALAVVFMALAFYFTLRL